MMAYANNVEPGEILAFTDEWVHSDPMRELAAEFGGSVGDGPLLESLTALVLWAQEHWDFRRGVERSDAPVVRFAADTEELVRRASSALGMTSSSTPSRDRYDHVLVLGGRLETCARRTSYAAELLNSVTASTVTGLGTFRETDDAEKARGVEIGLGPCGTEFEGMVAAFEKSFAPTTRLPLQGGDDDGHVYSAWRSQGLNSRTAGLSVLSAPSTSPTERRANTPDTYLFWAGRNHVEQDSSVLVVTASANRPFQHFDALRIFGERARCRIETVAVESMIRGAAPSVSSILQEVLAAIKKAERLVSSLEAASSV